VPLAEEELAVQVRHVDGVEVHRDEALEAHEHEVLQQLAADAAGADDEHLAPPDLGEDLRAADGGDAVRVARVVGVALRRRRAHRLGSRA
jgi:hypothetical protein